MELIDKAAVVAELEKLISNGKFKCQQSQENNDRESYIAWSEHIATCGKLFSFLNTLDVIEVDIDKEIPSKELADEIDALSKRYPEISFAKLSRIAVRIAKWQKEQDKKGE